MSQSSSISVIIPVLREEEAINDLIAHLRALDDAAEIIVVDGDPAESTIRAVDDKSAVTLTAAPGRAIQMNRGAALASGDILLFLHADTFLPQNAFPAIRCRMTGGRYAAGAFDLGIRTERKIFRITERYVALRSRLTRVPFGDQAIFIRRDYFEHIGGYSNIPIMEDVDLMRRIRKKGDRICIIPEKVMTSARRWEKEGVLCATLRNWMLQSSYALGVPPERLAKYYRSQAAQSAIPSCKERQ